MTTSTVTRLELGNNILNSVGERSQTSVGGVLGTTLASCIKESILYVCNANTWSELRSIINASSWSADAATLPDNTYRVRNVYWYTAPLGTPESSYDYYNIIVPYCDLEQYKTFTLVPFTSNTNSPRRWCIESKNKILVNPYPNNTLAKSKVKFEVYRYVSYPSSDSDYFACSDLLLNLIQYKASELFSIKHLNDPALAELYAKLYSDLYKQNMISDSGTPTQGYNMYRSRRSINRW